MTLAGLAVRNIRRDRLRTLLTVVGVAATILSFILIRTALSAWMVGSDYGARDRLIVLNKVSFLAPAPVHYAEKVREIAGVRTAAHVTWFGGKHPVRENDFFGSMAVESDTFFDVYSEMTVPADQMSNWKADRQGAIVGVSLAKQFDWSVGDEITLVGSIYPGDWTFHISGLYDTTQPSADKAGFYFHWDYLNDSVEEARKEKIGWVAAAINDPAEGADIGARIDARFDTAESQTRSMTERAFQLQFISTADAVLSALNVVSFVIIGIMMLILGNTIAMGVRERTRDFGVMLTLGFRPRQIATFVVIEGFTIGLIGGGLGLLLSFPIVEQGVGKFLEENVGTLFPYFRIPVIVSVGALVLAGGLGAVAALVSAYGAARLNPIDALRRLG